MSREIMQNKIKQAEKEISKKKDDVQAGRMRQHYHFMPQTGWLNDPNGLIYYKGKYHFFTSIIRTTGSGTICTGDML